MTLYCNQCGKTETEPYDIGDVCICGGLFAEREDTNMSHGSYFPGKPPTIPAASRPTPSGCWTRRADAERMETALRDIIRIADVAGRIHGEEQPVMYGHLTRIMLLARAALAPETPASTAVLIDPAHCTRCGASTVDPNGRYRATMEIAADGAIRGPLCSACSTHDILAVLVERPPTPYEAGHTTAWESMQEEGRT